MSIGGREFGSMRLGRAVFCGALTLAVVCVLLIGGSVARAQTETNGKGSPLTCEKLGCPDCSCVADKVKAKAATLAKAISKLLQANGIPPESLVLVSKTCLTRMQDKIRDASKTPTASQGNATPTLQALPDDPKCGCPNNCVGQCNNGSCQPTCAFGLCVGGCW